MQIDHKLLPQFDFNLDSSVGSVIASQNHSLPKNVQMKSVDLSLISKLLEIKPRNKEDLKDISNEEEFLKKYEEEIRP